MPDLQLRQPEKGKMRVGQILESDKLYGGLENVEYKYPSYACFKFVAVTEARKWCFQAESFLENQ